MKVIRIIRTAADIFMPQGMTRKISWCVCHCTAAPQNQSTQEMFNYWKNHNGWKTAGYHFDILADGTIEQFVEIDQIANGVAGYNTNAIHFCYKGGIDSKGNAIDNRTEAQKKSQLLIIKRLKELFPNAVFLGHRDFSTDTNGNGIIDKWEWIKSCPAFDFRDWLSKQGLDKVVVPMKIVYKLNYPLIKNDTVKAIQKALKIKVDGYYGSDTDKAVKDFQARNRLTVDGVVGKKTAELLGVTI